MNPRNAVTVAAAAIALTACAADQAASEPDPNPTTTSAAAQHNTQDTSSPAPTETNSTSPSPETISPAPTEEASASVLDRPFEERAYLADLRVLIDVDEGTLNDTRAVMLGKKACDFIGAGQGFEGTSAAVEGMSNSLDASQAQSLVISAVMNFCPEHDADLPQ